ncbi:unnamed protein product, partial [Scytosiphon promiscuus]
MPQPAVESKAPDPTVLQAIQLADLAGKRMTDTEVAALAAGVFEPADLVVPVVNGVALEKEEQERRKKQKEEQAARLKAAAAVKVKVESDEESSEEEEERDPAEPAGAPVQQRAEPQRGAVEGMELGKRRSGAAQEKVSGKPRRHDHVLVDDDKGGYDFLQVFAHTAHIANRSQTTSASCGAFAFVGLFRLCNSPSSSQNPHLPLTGPLSKCPAGDVTDGEDEDFMGSAVPMTKNEELEPILPLGEVSMDGEEMKKVGVILSLVEAAGTIVVQGESPPLDEGCVLVSSLVELQPDGETMDATGPKEPLGRIHEIFGPCSVPHYTVRVEGAATQHQLHLRHQLAAKKLLKAEKERAEARKAEVERIAQEEAAAEQARLCLDPVVAAEIAVAAAEQAQKEADEATAAAEAAAAAATAPLTAQQIREAAQRRARAKKTPNPNNEEQLEELRKLAKEAEDAVGAHNRHPFGCWKVGAAVYALKDAKALPRDKIFSGKGTDASNNHDEEAEEEDFSDDEAEKRAKIKAKENDKRDKLAMQGVLPDEIDTIMAEEEKVRREKKAKRDAANAARAAAKAEEEGNTWGGRGGRGGRGRGRGRGGE